MISVSACMCVVRNKLQSFLFHFFIILTIALFTQHTNVFLCVCVSTHEECIVKVKWNEVHLKSFYKKTMASELMITQKKRKYPDILIEKKTFFYILSSQSSFCFHSNGKIKLERMGEEIPLSIFSMSTIEW